MWKQLVGISVLSLIVFAAPARADRGDLDAAIDTADRAIEAIEQAAESKSLDARARATIHAQLDILRGLYAKHDDSMLLRRLARGLTNAIQAFHTTAPQAQRVLRLELRALVSAHATDEMHIWFAFNLIADYARSLEDAGNIANAALIDEEILEVIEAIESDAAQGLLRDGLSLAYARAHHLLTKRNEPRASERLVSRMRQLATQATATEVQRDRWSVILMNEVLRLVAQRNFVEADSIQGELHALTERADVTDRQLASRSYAWMIQARAHWSAGEVDVGDRWANKLWAFVESDNADRETHYLAAQMLDNQHWYARRREEEPALALALNRLRALVDRSDSAQDFVGSAKFRSPHSRLLLVLSREHRALRKAKNHVAADAILKEMRRAVKTPHEVVLLRARVDKHKLLGDEKKYDLVEPVLQMIRQTANGQSPVHRDLLARALAHAVWDIARQGRSGSADELIAELRGLTREHDTTSQQRARLIDALRGVLHVDLPRNERDALRDEAAMLGQEPGSKARVQFARLLEGQTTKLLTAKQFVQAAVYADALVAMNEADTATQTERASMLRALRVQINALEKAQRTDDLVVALARARTITHSAQAGALDRETWAHILSLRVWHRGERKETTKDLLDELRELAEKSPVDGATRKRLLEGLRSTHHALRKADTRDPRADVLLEELRTRTTGSPKELALALGCAHKHNSRAGNSKDAERFLGELRALATDESEHAQASLAAALSEAIEFTLRGPREGDTDALLRELRERTDFPGAPVAWREQLIKGLAWHADKALASHPAKARTFLDEARELCARDDTNAATKSWLAYMLAGAYRKALDDKDLGRARLLLAALNDEANRQGAIPHTRYLFAVALCHGVSSAGERKDFASALDLDEQLRALASSPHGSAEIRALLAPNTRSRYEYLVRAEKYEDAFVVLGQLRELASATSATQEDRDALAGALAYEVNAVFRRGGDALEAQRVMTELWRLATADTATEATRDHLATGIGEIHRAALGRAAEDEGIDRADIALSEIRRLVGRDASTEAQRDQYAMMLRTQHAYHVDGAQNERSIELLSHIEALAVDAKRSSETQRDSWTTSLEKHLTLDEAVAGEALSSFAAFARQTDYPLVQRHKLLARVVEIAYTNERDGAEDTYAALHDLGLGKDASTAGRTIHQLWLVGAVRRARKADQATLTKRIEADLRQAIAEGIGQKMIEAMRSALEDNED